LRAWCFPLPFTPPFPLPVRRSAYFPAQNEACLFPPIRELERLLTQTPPPPPPPLLLLSTRTGEVFGPWADKAKCYFPRPPLPLCFPLSRYVERDRSQWQKDVSFGLGPVAFGPRFPYFMAAPERAFPCRSLSFSLSTNRFSAPLLVASRSPSTSGVIRWS